MDAIATHVLAAHGGLERWRRFEAVSARLVQGGALWELKRQPDTLADTAVTVGTRSEWVSHFPFGEHRYRSRFRPERVSLETADGETMSELRSPRSTFQNHTIETPWNSLQLAYFAGTAMWTYMNLPFLLAWPGLKVEETAARAEAGESWRGLRLTFPPDIATHCRVQTLYVDDGGLMRRHDYDVDIAGGAPGAHFLSDYTEVAGIKLPTKHRVFPRLEDGRAGTEPLFVSIDVSEIVFE
ncbi:hypothetical protein [Mesorhizobium sp. B2-4-17]|uniref:hypothetical protein n=1 Tax=Mesorhizobium sp. B2-4-17 TaxID=2589932 RepID=UPI00112B316E|nr:hypothetical protein [Mesorhizobium sp. B2-4-17]TPK78142.1 hypothetical protein FJ548_25420 [Mesorhizobium sp. B2-4-17]